MNDERNFNDSLIAEVAMRLAEKYPKVLFVFHSYRKYWRQIFGPIKNILLYSALNKDDINKGNADSSFFHSHSDAKDGLVDFRICNEFIFLLVKMASLFVTSGNSGLGCFAQYAHPNMLCFVALGEMHWLTKHSNNYKCIRRETYNDFALDEVWSACDQMVSLCIKER